MGLINLSIENERLKKEFGVIDVNINELGREIQYFGKEIKKIRGKAPFVWNCSCNKEKQLSCASKANKTLDLVVLKLENEIALKNERLNLKLMDCLTESENTT